MKTKRILVIDYEQIVLDSISRILKDEDGEVEVSLSAEIW